MYICVQQYKGQDNINDIKEIHNWCVLVDMDYPQKAVK